MAKVISGSFNTGGYQGRYLTFSWTATQSTANNTSTISWSLKGGGDAVSSYYKAGNFKVVIAGETVYSSATRINLYKGTTVASGTKVITHNNDGTKSFSASAEAGIYSYAVNCKGSGSWELADIPRKATVTTAPDFTDENNPTIGYSNLAGNAVTSLQACIADTTGEVIYVPYRDISKTGTSYTFTLTSAERSTLRKAVTSGRSTQVKFYIKTVIGGVNYYSNLQKTLTLVNYLPTVAPVIKDVGTASTRLTGDENKIIKYHNYLSVATGGTANKEATIVSHSVECNDGKKITTSTGSLQNVESGQFHIVVVDSRGNRVYEFIEKTLIEYIKPTCNLHATPAITNDGTTTINVEVTGDSFNDTFGAVYNDLTVEYRYKKGSGSYSEWTAATVTTSGNTYKATGAITGLDYQSNYSVEARVKDQINTTNSTVKKVITKPVFDWGKDDFNFNVPVYVDGVNLSGAAKALSTSYSLPVQFIVNGAVYNDETTNITAYLMGGNLRIYVDAKRNSSIAAGNVANEKILTVRINHGGKIKDYLNVNSISGNIGGVASFVTANGSNTDGILTLDVMLCAVANASTEFSCAFTMPVILDLEKY